MILRSVELSIAAATLAALGILLHRGPVQERTARADLDSAAGQHRLFSNLRAEPLRRARNQQRMQRIGRKLQSHGNRP